MIPSVVSIISTTDVYDFFGGKTTKQSEGTGFVLTRDGYILTNKHVVSDSNARYTVITSKGESYPAKVVAKDPFNDLAAIKIKASNLKEVKIGNVNDLKVGQRVIAIGNALGEFQNSVTAGIVSGKGRALAVSDALGAAQERLENVIQTDAAINQGNSGGPLINLDGQVVGINTAMVSGGQTIGFALPINIIYPVDTFINNLKEKGKIIRPMIGVSYIPVTKELASLNELPVNYGALIYKGEGLGSAVVSGGPADKAGIKEGDIIIKVNDEKIDENQSLSLLIQKYQPGDEIELTVLRDKKEFKVKLKLVEYKGF